MRSNLLGIVSPEPEDVRIEGLQNYRPAPAISFLGRYRLIDFVVSNMTNSGISNIKVFVKKQPRSLIEQLGDGRQYNINTKRGKLQILYDETGSSGLYNNDISSYIQNMEFLKYAKEEYVVVSPGYTVYSLDFNDVLRQHVSTGADITVVYKSVTDANENYIGCPVLTTKDGRITGTQINLGDGKRRQISMEIYVLSRKMFMELVEAAHRASALYSFSDMLRSVSGTFRIMGYGYRGYYAAVNSLRAYYNASMELIDYDKARQIFRDEWPVYTKTNDSPPAFYGPHADVEHCLIANGCRINGKLTNCVLGRGVTVAEGCDIRDSVLLPFTKFGKESRISRVVVDKYAEVTRVKMVTGGEKIGYVRRRDRI